MRANSDGQERGQALVLLTLALVGLLGFAALAIDGGNLYTEHRRAQAAADNAVMAAAYQQMRIKAATYAVTRQAALDNAAINGYNNDGTTNWVGFYKPPIHGPYANNSGYLEVVITKTVPTALAHLVYRQNPIPLTVMAVARGVGQRSLMDGYAIASMLPNCTGSPHTIYMEGRGGGSTGGTYLFGGGAFINSPCPSALETSGQDPLYTDGAAIDVVGSGYGGTVCTAPNVPNNCNFYPPPTTGVEPVEQDPIVGTPAGTPPTCPSTITPFPSMSGTGTYTIYPGSYTTLDPGGNFHGTVNYAPGLYCLSGGTMTAGAGSIVGTGVMIYLKTVDARMDFSGNGNVGVTLTAPTTTTTGCVDNKDTSQAICAYLGIVVYKPVGYNTCDQNDVEIDFTGQAFKNVIGLVYAPQSLVRYGGNGNLLMTGQTIGGCVVFNGNGRIEIYFDPDVTYTPPPVVQEVQ